MQVFPARLRTAHTHTHPHSGRARAQERTRHGTQRAPHTLSLWRTAEGFLRDAPLIRVRRKFVFHFNCSLALGMIVLRHRTIAGHFRRRLRPAADTPDAPLHHNFGKSGERAVSSLRQPNKFSHTHTCAHNTNKTALYHGPLTNAHQVGSRVVTMTAPNFVGCCNCVRSHGPFLGISSNKTD